MSVPAFIDITETDQVSELCQFYESKDIKVVKPASSSLFENVKAIIKATSEIWKESETKDIEGIVNSILSLMFVIPISKGEELVLLLCDQLKFGADSGKSSVSLKLLHNLFHGYHPKTQFLYHVYCTWVTVAGQHRNIQMIPTDLQQIETWLGWWKVRSDDRHKLLRLLYEAFVNCGMSDKGTEVMIKVLESYTQENAGQAREDAVKCITRALADQNTYLFDHFLTLKPVKFLEGELLYDLLNIFVNGNVQEYEEFYKSNDQFVDSLGLSHESNLNKMKLLTLVDLVGDTHDITFDDVIERLGINEGEVEEFIIDAIQRKLIRGRIDEINRKVIVSQACQRTFGKAQWQQLGNRLQIWRNNLKKVNDRLRTVPA